MLKTPRFFHAGGLAALMALASLAACSGGCGNCKVPAFNGAPGATPAPNATPTPGVTPTPSPGVTPTPTPTPTRTPTPTPTPTPTLAPLSCSQGGSSIALGAALAPFALLAGSTITNVGNTLVTYTGTTHDDLIGVWPGTAVTGFYPPGTDTDGTNAIYAAGFNTTSAVPQAAQGALTTAYNTAAANAATTTFAGTPDLSQSNSGVSNCGATGTLACATGTLGAGVYHASSTASIMAGNLTLDGGGNAQSVFVFQIGTGLTTTLGGGISGNVILINGASPCNIYWQVGSSAVLGGATFYGNVLANQSITINATTFTGRALASVAAVSIPVAGGSLITNPGGS